MDDWSELCDGAQVQTNGRNSRSNGSTATDANYITTDAKQVNAKSIKDDAKDIMITGAQIRAARGLLRWSARELAEHSGVSLPTIQRMESAEGVPSASAKSVDSVQRAMERAGVEFIAENGGGDGVRFREPRGKLAQTTGSDSSAR